MTNPQNDLTPQPQVPRPLPKAATVPSALAPLALAAQAPALHSFSGGGPSSIVLAAEDQPLVAPKSDEGGSAQSALLALQFTAAPLQSLQNRPAGKPRNGKIAHLPKLERDMVDRMLSNNLPHHKIVSALQECGFQVTERNISNWKTRGGHKEWCAAQEHALELRTFQDNLTELLRRHDAAELPEVGLQSAATSLSAILLRPDLIRELISDPEKYSKLIELQCRLAREIQALQKNRDDAAKSLGRKYDPELLKRQNQQEVELTREVMSSKNGKSIREPDIPHRNFIPRELEPVPHTPEPLGLAALQQLQAALVRPRSAASPPPPEAVR